MIMPHASDQRALETGFVLSDPQPCEAPQSFRESLGFTKKVLGKLTGWSSSHRIRGSK